MPLPDEPITSVRLRWRVSQAWATFLGSIAPAWGNITGTMSAQSDLQSALDGKAAASHNHDGTYAPASHNHDGTYAPASHNHDGTYAPASHNHDGTYAPASHNHDGTYAALGHTHSEYMASGAIRVLDAAETKANDTSVQSWFASNSGVPLDSDSTYEFEGELRITKGGSSAALNINFADISGGSIQFSMLGCVVSINNGVATVRYSSDTRLNTDVLATTNATTAGFLVRVQGIVRTTTSGQTFTPRFSFSAAPGGTNQVLPGTRMRVRKIGANTFTNSGWA